MDKSMLFKKTYGCLAGQAVGDALGAVTEALHYKAIQRVYGRVSEEFFGKKGIPHFGGYWGASTDDHAYLRAIAKTIIRKGGRITAFEGAEGVIDFMNPSLIAPATHALAMMISGCVGEGVVSVHNLGQNQATNQGPTWACPPIGIVNACDPYAAAKDAYEVFSPWADGLSLEAPMAIAAAIAEAFKPNATMESIVDASTKYCGPKVATHIKKAVKLAGEFDDIYEASFSPKLHEELCIDGEGCEYKDYLRFLTKYSPEGLNDSRWDKRFNIPEDLDVGGHPKEIVAVPIAFFIIAKGDPMQAIRGAANFGRDCDGLAGMAGSIAGAWKGIDSSLESLVCKVDKLNKAWYKKSGEEYFDIAVLAEKMMQPILNCMKEKEETISSLRKLV